MKKIITKATLTLSTAFLLLLVVWNVWALNVSDPGFVNQWGLTKIQAPQAWDISQGPSPVVIAVLDSGVYMQHEDLGTKSTGIRISCTNDDQIYPKDVQGSGTAVAGVAAAVTNNGKGIAGVAPQAKLMNVKVVNDRGLTYSSWIANCIRLAVDRGAKVILISPAFREITQKEIEILTTALDYAWSRGALPICAVGPSGSTPSYPAAIKNCIAVGGTNGADQRSSLSGYGADWVDVAAPGENIYTTLSQIAYPGKLYGRWDGTAVAAAHVAGTAALIWGYNPQLTNLQVRDLIEKNADKIEGTGTLWQYGRINAFESLKATPRPI